VPAPFAMAEFLVRFVFEIILRGLRESPASASSWRVPWWLWSAAAAFWSIRRPTISWSSGAGMACTI
jgi:hypothetical protein